MQLQKQILISKIFIFICLGLFLIIQNNNYIMAMEQQNFDIESRSIDMRVELFNLLSMQKELVENINYFRNKNKLNNYEQKENIKLEKEYIELKQKISKIKKNILKNTKKVTFNLQPLIKIIE